MPTRFCSAGTPLRAEPVTRKTICLDTGGCIRMAVRVATVTDPAHGTTSVHYEGPDGARLTGEEVECPPMVLMANCPQSAGATTPTTPARGEEAAEWGTNRHLGYFAA